MLITTDFFKSNFPLWRDFCQNTDGIDPDVVLQNAIGLGEAELVGYVQVDETNISPQLRLHLFNIIRYRLFGLHSGDSQFDNDPQIVKDYKASIEMLSKYKSGELIIDGAPLTGINHVAIKSKRRRFGRWFDGIAPTNHEKGLY